MCTEFICLQYQCRYEDDCLQGCCGVVSWKLTDVLGMLILSIIKAIITSETSANLYETTRRNIPEIGGEKWQWH
jgi:hypothetical protein